MLITNCDGIFECCFKLKQIYRENHLKLWGTFSIIENL